MTLPPLDFPTLILTSAIAVAFAGVMLVMTCWRDYQARALAPWGGAMILSAAGLLTLVGAPLPRPWCIVGGDALLVIGASLSWAGARVFSGLPKSWILLAAGPAILLAQAALMGVNAGHVELTLILVGTYSAAAAADIARCPQDGLRSRFVAVSLAGIHAGLQFARAAGMVLAHAWCDAHSRSIYTAVFLEAMLYAIGMSSALLTLLMEQVALRTTSRLRRMTMVDELTGLGNRRQFDEALGRHISRAEVSKRPIALLMVDVDYFKMYNDTYGHLPGDDCLRDIAGAIGEVTRKPNAIATRYGGEEFAVLLYGTDEYAAMQIATRIHTSVAGLRIKHATSPYGTLTVSIGVAAVMPGDPPGTLVRQADWALYVAKSEGRNSSRAASETRQSGVLRPTG